MSSRRVAFSMIELVIVVLILGITAALAAPRFSDSVRASQLRAAAHQMAAHIDHVRNVAVRRGQTTTLSFDHDRNVYYSDDVDFPDRPGIPLAVSVSDRFDAGFAFRANFDSLTELSFDFEGIPMAGENPLQSGRVVLKSGRHQFVVTIDAGTGSTSVASRPTVVEADTDTTRTIDSGGTASGDDSDSDESETS